MLEKELGRDASSLSYLHTTRRGIKALLKYVHATGRLKSTFGDVSPPETYNNDKDDDPAG
ncbi:hypothetical protein PLICRDRAFT_139242 [Plicaturopsis crispa FD-325 SS-3]|nr:hypothetical protein PLICRDRAFT_139242 [Plicaturopsis crispa FD-325 SS-3]